ncbi:hypothetical protein [Rhodococcus opacus]|uniref:hypothetical protein n=1 Tax=Rhodococcus opacus TaxID=37919 RepID=UPI003D7B9FA0
MRELAEYSEALTARHCENGSPAGSHDPRALLGRRRLVRSGKTRPPVRGTGRRAACRTSAVAGKWALVKPGPSDAKHAVAVPDRLTG